MATLGQARDLPSVHAALDALLQCLTDWRMQCRLGVSRASEDASEAALGELIRVSCSLRGRSPMLWPSEVAVKLGQVLAAGKGIGPQWELELAEADEFTGVTAV